jgi:hypothetical protein
MFLTLSHMQNKNKGLQQCLLVADRRTGPSCFGEFKDCSCIAAVSGVVAAVDLVRATTDA